MAPMTLLDIAIGENGYVELFFENRRVIFDRDTAGQEIWAIASLPPSAEDGSGRIDATMSTADVIARATKRSA